MNEVFTGDVELAGAGAFKTATMESTRLAPVPPHLGVDLTDRYSAECRDIDACGLQPVTKEILRGVLGSAPTPPGNSDTTVLESASPFSTPAFRIRRTS